MLTLIVLEKHFFLREDDKMLRTSLFIMLFFTLHVSAGKCKVDEYIFSIFGQFVCMNNNYSVAVYDDGKLALTNAFSQINSDQYISINISSAKIESGRKEFMNTEKCGELYISENQLGPVKEGDGGEFYSILLDNKSVFMRVSSREVSALRKIIKSFNNLNCLNNYLDELEKKPVKDLKNALKAFDG